MSDHWKVNSPTRSKFSLNEKFDIKQSIWPIGSKKSYNSNLANFQHKLKTNMLPLCRKISLIRKNKGTTNKLKDICYKKGWCPRCYTNGVKELETKLHFLKECPVTKQFTEKKASEIKKAIIATTQISSALPHLWFSGQVLGENLMGEAFNEEDRSLGDLGLVPNKKFWKTWKNILSKEEISQVRKQVKKITAINNFENWKNRCNSLHEKQINT